MGKQYGSIITKCFNECGNEVKESPSRIRAGRGRFCSRKCFNEYRKKSLQAEKNPCWRGGRHLKVGYWFVYMPGHPKANNNRYVAEHRLIMEKSLGRYLLPNEIVHHINHIKTDNRIENLTILTKSEHHKHHSRKENNAMFGKIRDGGLNRLREEIMKETNKYYNNEFPEIREAIIEIFDNGFISFMKKYGK